VPSIVTCCPPETGVTAAILSTVVPLEPISVSLYVQVFPTAIGYGTELLETADVEPLELVFADFELAGALLLPEEPELLDEPEPEFAVPQPTRARPAAAASATAAAAGWRGEDA
jgi:hypothetical protein